MEHPPTSPTEQLRYNGDPERNCLEIIRFASREDCRRAIAVLLERRMLTFSSSTPNEWGVRTEVVRTLRGAACRSSGSPNTPEMPAAPLPERRPINLDHLEAHVQKVKLREGIELPTGKKKASLSRDLFVPTIQAEIGSSVPVSVYRYRLLVPIAQIIQESAQAIRRILVATGDDIEALQNAFVRHFGGVTVHHQVPAAVRGIGAAILRTCLARWNRMNTWLLNSMPPQYKKRTITSVLSAENSRKPSRKVSS